MTGPLADVRVVDLTAMLSGPYSTMLLADLGADVVKVEPERGDMTRQIGPFRPDDGPQGLSGYFQSVNRGKRSVVLDLKTEQGRMQLIQLVREADVLVENFSAGVMDRLGLGYETLAAENPRLVYGAIRGFGDPRSGVSPYTDWPALDVVAQAMGGLLSVTGSLDGSPIKVGPGVGDLFPATLLATGVLAALHHARRTGRGQFVDVAMYDAVMSLCERIVYQYSYLGEVPVPQGNTHPLMCPFDIFRTADGWVALAAPQDHHWQMLTTAMGQGELAADPRFATGRERSIHAVAVRAVVEPWLAERTTADVVRRLGGLVPMGPVNDVAALFEDPHTRARDMLVDVDQPGSDTPVVLAGQPIKLSETPSHVSGRAPLLGETTSEAVLESWGSPG